MKRLLLISLALLAMTASAAYDPNDGSIYSCNEGNTPALCRERELQQQQLEKQQRRENKARDSADNTDPNHAAHTYPTHYQLQPLPLFHQLTYHPGGTP